jgi:hypothetical protein
VNSILETSGPGSAGSRGEGGAVGRAAESVVPQQVFVNQNQAAAIPRLFSA